MPTWSTDFELEGNPTDEANGGTDWNTVHPGGTGVGAYSYTSDPAPNTVFTTGGSKDEQDITSWRWKDGSVPPKDDITNAFAAGFTDDDANPATADDVIVTFGLDRREVNGDANVGFWFLKNDLPDVLPANGTFGIDHEVGDVLVISGFSNGGDVSTIQVYEWVLPEDETAGLDNLKVLYTSTEAECGANDAADACGIANKTALTNAPEWPYPTPTSAANSGDYAISAFFEGAVNLTNLFAGAGLPGNTPCFSSFVAETRSSTSVSATLKDFTHDSFDLCGANIAASPLTATNGIGEKHTVTITATKSILGQAPTVASTGHVDVTLAHSVTGATITQYPAESTCHSGGAPHTADNLDNATGTCTITFSSDVAGDVTVNATANIDIGGGNIVTASTGTTGNSGPAVKTYKSGTLKWEKRADSTTGALLAGAEFEVCRTHNWNTDTSQYDDIADNCRTVKDLGTTGVAAGDTTDTDTTAGEFQLDGLILGTWTIEEKVAPTGYVLDSTKRTVNISLSSGNVVSSPSATWVFVNVAQFRLIVLTCNMADESLIRSEVDFDGSNATTNDRKFSAENLPAALAAVTNAESILCTAGGANNANFPNLNAGNYAPGVQLPDVP